MSGSELLLTLLGGVALLLWGVRMVRTGLTRTFGAALRSILNHASRNRLVAFSSGVGVAGVLQSATATALLLASFAGRGLLTLPIALAIMLGADVGTTLVAQAFAFDVKWLWAGFMIAGVVAFNASDRDRIKNLGRISIGLALMLLALSVLGGVSGALRGSPTVQTILTALGSEPVIAIIVAAVITWLSHSSLAMVLFVMALAASGAVSPSLAIALVLGANIGGAIAPFMALSGSPVAARRVPLGNFIARATVAIIAIPMIAYLADWLSWFSADPARLVLNFHTAFNLAVAMLFLPLLDPLAKLATSALPPPPEDMKISAFELSQLLNGTIEGDPSVSVTQPGKIESGKAGEICFLGNPKYEEYAYTTEASILLVNQDFQPKQAMNATLIRVENVYTSLAFLLEKFSHLNQAIESIVSEKASIHPSVLLGKNVTVGDFAVIEEGAIIGDNCLIFSQVYIGKKVFIKENSLIYAGVKVYHDCQIGARRPR